MDIKISGKIQAGISVLEHKNGDDRQKYRFHYREDRLTASGPERNRSTRVNKIELPQSYLENMKQLLGSEFDAYLDSFQDSKISGLRVNTLKADPKEFAGMFGPQLEPVLWTTNGFYYDGEERLSKDPCYFAGLYYLQEPSAMAPAQILPVEPGDRVLDLCAAPGGKSTELASRLKGKGILVSNDISNSRAKALLKNLELWGASNICVTSEEPGKLQEVFGEYFDKILIDAPCSGEGMFRKDRDMIKSYGEKGPAYYCEIQKQIVDQAVRLLVPGGMMLYSTCTFSVCEDEDMIRYILSSYPQMELVPIPLFPGASPGFDLEGVLRLFPHKIRGEGHFLALLRKKGEKPLRKEEDWGNAKTLPAEVSEFLSLIRRDLAPEQIRVKKDLVFYLPKDFPVKEAAKLRCLRTGLLLGQLKNKRFEPSQALAMVLRPEEFENSICLSRDDDRVIRYLKGETLTLREEEKAVQGWCLVCMDQYPLGFAKGSGTTLKNKYYPGWRWQ